MNPTVNLDGEISNNNINIQSNAFDSLDPYDPNSILYDPKLINGTDNASLDKQATEKAQENTQVTSPTPPADNDRSTTTYLRELRNSYKKI